MAALTWPEDIIPGTKIVSTQMDLQRAQASSVSERSYLRTDADFGGARMRGQLTIGQYGWGERAQAFAVGAFLRRLSDAANWCDHLPTYLPALKLANDAAAIVYSAAREVGQELAVTIAGDHPDATAGQLCRIGRRLYEVVDVPAGGLVLQPGIVPADLAGQLSAVSTVRAKLTPGSGPVAPWLGEGFMGPWIVSWDEWVQ